jgi:polysaccharide biosynthesis/export protein
MRFQRSNYGMPAARAHAAASTARGRFLRLVASATIAVAAAGCARLGQQPRNLDRGLFSPEAATAAEEYEGQRGGLAPDHDPSRVCPAPGTPNFIMPAPPRKGPSRRDVTMRYSPGDRFNITVPGMEDFTGDYMIGADGRVILPFAGEIPAVGMTNSELQQRVESAYIKAGIFKRDGLKLAVRPVQYAPVNVYVQGAVFGPGRSVINNLKDSDKTEKFMTKYGDAPLDRFIPSALHSAGGVRPDADVSRITLIRGAMRIELDWRGAFTGDDVEDMALIEGDRLYVPESPCFQSGLVRPSQITTPGIRVLMSNLTQPALQNANSAINKDSTSLPYGTRFLQGLIVANCVGGARTSNAERHAVLISRNPKTQQTEVVQRSIEELVRSADRDSINPFLMPDDAIACYDSKTTEFREVMTTLGGLFGNVSSAHTYRKW